MPTTLRLTATLAYALAAALNAACLWAALHFAWPRKGGVR